MQPIHYIKLLIRNIMLNVTRIHEVHQEHIQQGLGRKTHINSYSRNTTKSEKTGIKETQNSHHRAALVTTCSTGDFMLLANK